MIEFTLGLLVGLYLEQEYDLPSVKLMTETLFAYGKQLLDQYNKTKAENTHSVIDDSTKDK